MNQTRRQVHDESSSRRRSDVDETIDEVVENQEDSENDAVYDADARRGQVAAAGPVLARRIGVGRRHNRSTFFHPQVQAKV